MPKFAPIPSPMVVVVDTREQLPYSFPKDVKIVHKGLKTGDYSLEGLEDKVCIERKSMNDLFLTVGKGRERFERELERMAEFDHAVILIESSLLEIAQPYKGFRSQLPPKIVVRSLLTWSQRYNVVPIFAGPRKLSQTIAWLILDRFWRDYYGKKEI